MELSDQEIDAMVSTLARHFRVSKNDVILYLEAKHEKKNPIWIAKKVVLVLDVLSAIE